MLPKPLQHLPDLDKQIQSMHLRLAKHYRRPVTRQAPGRRDDFIQGIIFSRTNLVDLRRMSRSERLMYKVLSNRPKARS